MSDAVIVLIALLVLVHLAPCETFTCISQLVVLTLFPLHRVVEEPYVSEYEEFDTPPEEAPGGFPCDLSLCL